jgi:hypothetical protein
MNLSGFLKSKFGKDLFTHLRSDEILEERIKTEKQIERISDDIKRNQQKIQSLMLESKGQPKTLKLLNIQKIKALRLETATKQQEANTYIRQLQLLLLLEAMKEHHKTEEKNEFIEKVLNSDIEHLNKVLFDTDVKKAIEEGKIETVKDKLKNIFAKEDIPMDTETRELLSAIDDLEKVDEETALKMATEKAKQIAEAPVKKEVELEEE